MLTFFLLKPLCMQYMGVSLVFVLVCTHMCFYYFQKGYTCVSLRVVPPSNLFVNKLLIKYTFFAQ